MRHKDLMTRNTFNLRQFHQAVTGLDGRQDLELRALRRLTGKEAMLAVEDETYSIFGPWHS